MDIESLKQGLAIGIGVAAFLVVVLAVVMSWGLKAESDQSRRDQEIAARSAADSIRGKLAECEDVPPGKGLGVARDTNFEAVGGVNLSRDSGATHIRPRVRAGSCYVEKS